MRSFYVLCLCVLGCGASSTATKDSSETARNEKLYDRFFDLENEKQFRILDTMIIGLNDRHTTLFKEVKELREGIDSLRVQSPDASFRGDIDGYSARHLHPLFDSLEAYHLLLVDLRGLVSVQRSRWQQDRRRFANEWGYEDLFGDLEKLTNEIKQTDRLIKRLDAENDSALLVVMKRVCAHLKTLGAHADTSACDFLNTQP
ncbi:MAG: hypothetical protein CMI52_04080 [Parcubacteria group bacterium]|nr:hypothetical protein [Parcubacteria group bacterium]